MKMKYIKIYESKTIIYCYYRRGQFSKRIRNKIGTALFYKEYADIQKQFEKSDHVQDNSIAAMINIYKKMPEFTELSEVTKKDYMFYLEKITEQIGHVALQDVTKQGVFALRDKYAQKYRTANRYLCTLKIIMNMALRYGYIEVNPCNNVPNIKRPKNLRPMNRVWTEQEYTNVIENSSEPIRRIITIAYYTGLRKSDILNLKWSDIINNTIVKQTQKQHVIVEIPILPELAQMLTPNNSIYVCTNSKGVKWSKEFNATFSSITNKLYNQGLIGKGLTLHGLRHTAATRLANQGVSSEVIASVLGQKTSQMAQHYSKTAQRANQISATIHKLSREK